MIGLEMRYFVLSPKKDSECDLDPLWLEALRKSEEHHLDGVNCTEKNYNDFNLSYDSCACCKYWDFENKYIDACAHCFLYDRITDTTCAGEYWDAVDARQLDDFPAFHAAELALLARIVAERERVEKIQAEHKSAHKAGEVYDEIPVKCPECGKELLIKLPFCHITTKKGKKQPVTRVTVWEVVECNAVGIEIWNEIEKSHYSFKGLPDIDRVIRETLEKGALAVKVECPEVFKSAYQLYKSCYIWQRKIGTLNNNVGIEFSIDIAYIALDRFVTDSDIEAAITKWLKSPKPTAAVSFESEPEPFHVGQIVNRCGVLTKVVEIDNKGLKVITKGGVEHWHSYKLFRPATEAEVAEFYLGIEG